MCVFGEWISSQEVEVKSFVYPWYLGQVVQYHGSKMWIKSMRRDRKLELALMTQNSHSSMTCIVDEADAFPVWAERQNLNVHCVKPGMKCHLDSTNGRTVKVNLPLLLTCFTPFVLPPIQQNFSNKRILVRQRICPSICS